MTHPRTNDPDSIKILKFYERRRRWSPIEKVRIVEKNQAPVISVSAVACLYRIAHQRSLPVAKTHAGRQAVGDLGGRACCE